ncbi:hypothetical protein [Humidesulfovibrio sp.]
MNPDIAQILRVLGIIAGILQQLGVPGLVMLLLGGPAAVLIAVLVLNHFAQRRQERVLEMYRKDMAKVVADAQAAAAKQLETYRADTLSVVRELGENQRQTAQFYRDNVELVKAYARMANDLSDLVAANVQALERLAGKIENNLFCPVARERARGQA